MSSAEVHKKLTVVFLGTNHPHMFRRIEILNKMEDVEVLGFFEEDDVIAEQFMARCAYKRFLNLDDMLILKPDLVIVESKLTQIAPYAKAAAPYTRALLLEKCTAPNLEVAMDLAEYLEKFPVHVMDGFVIRYLEIMDICKEILNSGVMGQVTLARFHSTFPVGFGVEMWQSDPACMGGIVYTEGGHIVDLMLDTLGVPISVHGSIVKLPLGEKIASTFVWADTFRNLRGQPVEVQVGGLMYEDVGAAIMHYPDKLVTLDVTAWAPDKGKGWSMEFIGTNSTLLVHPWDSKLELSVAAAKGGYETGVSIIDLGRDAPNGDTNSLIGRTYATQLERLIDLLRTNAEPSQKGMDRIVSMIKIMDALYKSSSNGVQI